LSHPLASRAVVAVNGRLRTMVVLGITGPRRRAIHPMIVVMLSVVTRIAVMQVAAMQMVVV